MATFMHSRGFRRRLVLGAAVAGALAATVPARSHVQATGFGLTDRAIVASRIYAMVQLYFAHWDGVERSEVDRAYREYLDQALPGADRKGFDLATMRFIAKLRNGHTQFFDNQLDGRPLKFRLLQVENEWVVVNSQDSHLPRGAIVRTLNASAVDDFVRERAQYVAASNDRLARTHVFSYPGLFPERVSLGLQDGRVVAIERSIPGDAPGAAPLRVSEGRWLRADRLAYIRIAAFADPGYERTAIELVRQFGSSPDLIVDVRGNGGGATPRLLIGALMNRPWRTWQETTPQHVALFDALGIPPIQASRGSRRQPPSADAYAGRLFVLVDRFCGSACEDFVMPFKDTGRALIIGETTQGSSGNPYRADLGNGMSVAIGAVRYRFPDDTDFEGVGIAPDVSVERTRADLVNDRDAVLERAQEVAGLQPDGRSQLRASSSMRPSVTR
jgi:carboxyl-terminal processing protease